MEFKVNVVRIPLSLTGTDCKVNAECSKKGDFYVNDLSSCRDHLWLVLMHEHRKATEVPCLRCIPQCDNGKD